MLGIISIVGRPNVGKSTLFNRLTRTSKALVDDRPGVTRDRIYEIMYEDDPVVSAENHIAAASTMLIDTGGFETEDLYYQPFSENIVWKQTEIAIEQADIVVLLLDGKFGLHPHDKELNLHLKKHNKHVFYVVNKIDGPEHKNAMWDFMDLGGDNLIAISAAHNRGVGELKKALFDRLLTQFGGAMTRPDAAVEKARSIALIGRPNVGKSSILNRLLGEERSLVSDIPGTTRDTVDTLIKYNQKPYLLLDTAGIRRKSRINEKLEILSVIRSMRAIERADIICLVIDGYEGLHDQDAKLASMAMKNHKPVVVVVNKWDLVPNKDTGTAELYRKLIFEKLGFTSPPPVLFISCKENQRVHGIFGAVEHLFETYSKRIDTSDLNEAMHRIVKEHTPALIHNRSRRIKFYYATQVRANPPTIIAFCNVADEVQESYKRYMIKRFQTDLGFESVPIQLILRGKNDKEKKALN